MKKRSIISIIVIHIQVVIDIIDIWLFQIYGYIDIISIDIHIQMVNMIFHPSKISIVRWVNTTEICGCCSIQRLAPRPRYWELPYVRQAYPATWRRTARHCKPHSCKASVRLTTWLNIQSGRYDSIYIYKYIYIYCYILYFNHIVSMCTIQYRYIYTKGQRLVQVLTPIQS